MDNLAAKIKTLREARNWSQQMLANKTGISRSLIGQLETGARVTPSADKLLKFAAVFNINVNDLYESMGIVNQTASIPHQRPERPEEILERLRLATPVSIPVYDNFVVHAGDPAFAPVDYIYRTRESSAPQNVEAYRVKGHCMEPIISEEDIVLIDRDRVPQKGDIVLCVVDGEVIVGKLIEQDGRLYLKNGHGLHSLDECQASAVVIEVNKKLVR